MINPLTELQLKRNQQSRENWEASAPHRERVTAAILSEAAATGRERLCVVGAGNCHELELPQLCATFAEVHLVDLDAEAVLRGVARQNCAEHPQIVIHGGIDITGAWNEMGQMADSEPAAPDDSSFEKLLERVRTGASDALPGSFDLTVSVCLLSQLVEGLLAAIGERHPRLVEALQTLRAAHGKQLINWTRPGGAVMLIVDFVSSVTAPQLPSIPESQLPQALVDLINASNFFHGLNPFVLLHELQTAAKAGGPVADPRMFGLWRWQLGQRTYAVAGLRFKRQ